jgi:hypothetical protein
MVISKGKNMLLVFETSKIMLVNPTMMNILKSVCLNSEEMKYTSTVRSRRVGSCSFFLRAADFIAISKDNNWSLCRQCKSFEIHSKWETVGFFYYKLIDTHTTHTSLLAKSNPIQSAGIWSLNLHKHLCKRQKHLSN